jgi:SAM-dependent methyltransferase
MNIRGSRNKGKGFWDKEYKKGRPTIRSGKQAQGSHLALSNNPSEDLIKFTRWLQRNADHNEMNTHSSVLDLGCGNGRNLIYLAKIYSIQGTGYDISNEAITQAKQLSKDLPLKYEARSIAGPLSLEDQSQDLVLDMMTSHFLNHVDRKILGSEIARVLKPGGWLYFKTFLRDEDVHAERLLRERPAEEKGSYIHPKIGVAEHVFTEDEIEGMLKDNFIVHKMLRSHRHRDERGHAAKRRSISIYAERI